MEIQSTELVNITTRAILHDDGSLRLSLQGSMSYGPDERTVGMTYDITDAETVAEVTEALTAIRDRFANVVLYRTRAAQREAEGIALRRGEYDAMDQAPEPEARANGDEDEDEESPPARRRTK